MRTLRILGTVACALVGVALLVAAGQSAPQPSRATAKKAVKAHAATTHKVARATTKPAAAAPVAQAPGQAGMVIAVDPVTGGLRMPTPEELQALYVTPADPSNESDIGLVPVHHLNGMVSLDLQGRFQDYMVVRIGPDGRPIFGCAKTAAAAIGETFNPNRPSGVLEEK